VNEYRFQEIEVGLTESFETTVTLDIMDAFTKITGDTNPLHMSNNFAKQQNVGGGGRV
jgi:3-hydroxybutyryl-CoA dehydratase